MRLPVDSVADENYIKVASMQKDLVVSLVNAGIKVDENRFRKKSAEALVDILGALKKQEQALSQGGLIVDAL